ncbi:hypothetical protein [Chitinophaga sp.]|uniref:hypothetical protein n=1 Tax=Chitinophaga sp. TaxID=1869181 RepID=UPI002F93530C
MKRFFLLTSVCCLTAVMSNAQILNQTTLQSGANFNIDGIGRASLFNTSRTTAAGLGSGHYMLMQNGVYRWGLGTTNVESGTNLEGSDFALFGYNNDGSLRPRYLTIMRSNGFAGINTASPTAQLHVSGLPATDGAEPTPLAKFTYTNVAETEAVLRFSNATYQTGAYIPGIIGRSYSPGRPYGISLNGEAEDVVPSALEPYSAAVMLDGRSKTNARLANANVFSVNSYGTSLLMIKANGNVGIGTTAPGTNKLAVEGTIAARRVKVTQAATWPDYVFEQDYPLPSLQKTEAFIRENKHLPEVPSAKEVAENGQDLGDMNAILLKKVEELTLHLIAMQKEIMEVKATNKILTNELKTVRAALSK